MIKVRIKNGGKPTVFPWGVLPAGKDVVMTISENGRDILAMAFAKKKIRYFEILQDETEVEAQTEEVKDEDAKLEEARKKFEALTGKKAGRRKLETLLKEISDASG